MRDDLWTLVRFLHVLGAACWVGGMIVLGAVAVPAARQRGRPRRGPARGDHGGPPLRRRRRAGLRGAHRHRVRPHPPSRDRRSTTSAQSDYGRRILAKMGLLVAMGVVTLLHALWQGPRVRRAEEAGDPVAARRWRTAGRRVRRVPAGRGPRRPVAGGVAGAVNGGRRAPTRPPARPRAQQRQQHHRGGAGAHRVAQPGLHVDPGARGGRHALARQGQLQLPAQDLDDGRAARRCAPRAPPPGRSRTRRP